MSRADTSLLKRVVDLEQRLRAAEADLRLARQSPPSWAAPRERWLGRIATSPTPSAGDHVYKVELLNVVYDDSAPGSSPLTSIVERGTTVNALAWPQADYAAEQYVVVERIRGALSNNNYSGEWFLTQPASFARCVLVGDTYGLGLQPTYFFNEVTSDAGPYPVIGTATVGYGSLWVHPSIDGTWEHGGVVVFEQSNPPTSYLSPYLFLSGGSLFRITIHTTWFLESMTESAAQGYYGKTITTGGHQHVYNDYFVGATLTGGPVGDGTYYRNLLDKTFSVETSVIQTLVGVEAGRLKTPMGRSGIPPHYIESSPLERHACHSGTMLLRAPTTEVPREIRIQVEVAESNGMPNIARLRYMQLTIEQISG